MTEIPGAKTMAKPAKPPRSPVERAIVWGVIIIGLLVVGLEARAHFAHSAAMGKLQDAIEKYENGESDTGITEEDVDRVLAGMKPTSDETLPPGTAANGASRLEIYDFPGLMRVRQLYVYYGVEGKQKQAPEVLQVSPGPAETQEAALAKIQKDLPAPGEAPASPGGPGPGGPGAPGMGPGGPGAPGPGGPGGPGGERRGGRRRPTEEGPNKGGEASKDAEPKADAKKPADEKSAEAKSADAKPAETKPEGDAKPEAPKADEPKKDEAKPDEPKATETPKEETKPEETKPEEKKPE